MGKGKIIKEYLKPILMAVLIAPDDDVLGKAFVIYFSWNRRAESWLHDIRWSRIGEWIH